MQAAYLVPELALARVVTAGGPYRPGDDLSLAFTTPTVSRLVAHDAELRAKCVTFERALVPETIAVVITHAAAPYAPGEVLTLSFVDPRVARIHESPAGQPRSVVPEPSSAITRADSLSEDRAAQSPVPCQPDARVSHAEDSSAPQRSDSRSDEPSLVQAPGEHRSATEPSAATASAETRARERFAAEVSERPLTASDLGISYSLDGAMPSQIRAGERMTLREDALVMHDANRDLETHGTISEVSNNQVAATEIQLGIAVADSQPQPSPGAHAAAHSRVTVRLEWKTERLRRFVQVVDKLFTIDRLGWYRHSLAMRLLIPDEIACGDMLANVEAMRHLQALRAAAVESLGTPLLAACMPGFSISSEWLETIESSREARAIAGLREALSPYANDGDDDDDTPSGEGRYTTGTILRRELLAENATSVEAFLPLLIATKAHDGALGVRLAEYRRLLIELFAQTARAGEPVRLHQMAQPNHSLDDRLWQLVGAAAEAFGGFAHA